MSNTIVKSGAWYDDTGHCRSASRDGYGPGLRARDAGLRLGLDPVQPQHIILRGGSWISDGCRVRSAYRDGYCPGLRVRDTGLRLALTTSIEP